MDLLVLAAIILYFDLETMGLNILLVSCFCTLCTFNTAVSIGCGDLPICVMSCSATVVLCQYGVVFMGGHTNTCWYFPIRY